VKILKVLTILTTLTISSGCSLFKEDLIEPLCLERRPLLQPVSVPDQRLMKVASEEGFATMALNDRALKDWIVVTERTVEVHNEQFKAKCFQEEVP
jgi:hypothetical protein